MKLNEKQQRFVQEYLVDLNATQAALRAGYSAKTAYSSGPRLLGHVGVQAAITAGRQALEARTGITQERVLAELAKIGFSDIRKIFDDTGRLKLPGELDDETAGAIASIEVVTRSLGEGEVEYIHKIKASDKRAALVDIGKHLGMFAPEKEPPPPQGINLTINNVEVTINQVRTELTEIFDAARGSAHIARSEH